jgi:hypothetical protein
VPIGWYCRHCKMFETDRTVNSAASRVWNLPMKNVDPAFMNALEELPYSLTKLVRLLTKVPNL